MSVFAFCELISSFIKSFVFIALFCFRFWITESTEVEIISNSFRFIDVKRTTWNHRFCAKISIFCKIVIMMRNSIVTSTITVESRSEIFINSISVNFSTCFSLIRENFWIRFFDMNRSVFAKTVWAFFSIRTFCNILLFFERFFR